MIVDLLHNKIVKDTMTDSFRKSVYDVLAPLLSDRYGNAVERITMYEDYLNDDFLIDGEWHYPLSVKCGGEDTKTVWIKWTVDKKRFTNANPYMYVGADDIDFALAGFVPQSFADRLAGRAIDYDRSDIPVNVDAPVDNPLLFVGKYSQTFVDELAHQVTAELRRALGVEDFTGSTMELNLLFAPDTYLEHTSENVTYRRLILSDKGCRGRDFWVKWTRLDGAVAYRVFDNVSTDKIKFELGEDVAQKIREKEFRFLCNANPDKYQSAMGKKTVTEWRDITKRAIKRGELVRTVNDVSFEPSIADVSDKLKAMLDNMDTPAPAVEAAAADEEFDPIAALARKVLGQTEETVEEPIEELPEIAPFDVDEDETETVVNTDDAETVTDSDEPEETDEPETEFNEEPAEDIEELPEIAPFDGFIDLTSSFPDETEEDAAPTESEKQEPIAPVIDEDAIRREIEAKLRIEYETELRQKAEQEAERLRAEHERLRLENERLAELARAAEEQRKREEESRRLEEERKRAEQEAERLAEIERQRLEEEKRAEEARIRAEIEAKMRSEQKERERIAEAARLAVEEQKRLEAERAEREARERQEAYARESERLRREEEARRLEEQRRIEELRRLEEDARRRREEEEARARVQIVTKRAKILFRFAVDVNIVMKIKGVIEQTLIAHNKEKLNIHIKALPIDSSSISLEIMLPQNETNLLVNMMKALGNASLGITKIILE